MKNIAFITLNKKNIRDFAKERNELLLGAKSNWVFFVDSDETISNNIREEVERVISNPRNKYNGFYIYRKDYFLGEYSGTDKILRLGKRNCGHWERKVHEVWAIKGSIGQLKNPLIHNTADNLHDFVAKINFYSTLHAEENLKEGKKSNIVKIIIFPVLKFIQSMIIGRGFVMSMLQSFHSFLSWSKEWTL